MAWKVSVSKNEEANAFNVWLRLDGDKHKIGNDFSFNDERTRHSAWNLALQLACRLEENLMNDE